MTAVRPAAIARRCCLIVVAALLVTTNAACALARQSLELEVTRLEDQLLALHAAEADLTDPSFPPGQRDLELFLSYDALNEVLAGVRGLSMPLPNDLQTVVTIDSLALEPTDGMALLDLRAHASRGEVRVEITMLAQGVIDQSQHPPLLKVRVRDIAPRFSWRGFRFGRWRLARKIATAEADELALNHLALSLPMERSIKLTGPALNYTSRELTPRGNGSWIDLRITRPAIARQRTLRVDRSLMLRDGIHIFASLNEVTLP